MENTTPRLLGEGRVQPLHLLSLGTGAQGRWPEAKGRDEGCSNEKLLRRVEGGMAGVVVRETIGVVPVADDEGLEEAEEGPGVAVAGIVLVLDDFLDEPGEPEIGEVDAVGGFEFLPEVFSSEARSRMSGRYSYFRLWSFPMKPVSRCSSLRMELGGSGPRSQGVFEGLIVARRSQSACEMVSLQSSRHPNDQNLTTGLFVGS